MTHPHHSVWLPMIAGLCLILGGCDSKSPSSSAPGAGNPEAAKLSAKDQELLQGTWKVVKQARGGKDTTDKIRNPSEFEFKDDTVTMRDGRDTVSAKYTIDASKSPKTIDLMFKVPGPALAIYRIDGDSLTLCMVPEAKEHPSEFESKAGSEASLLELKRVKK